MHRCQALTRICTRQQQFLRIIRIKKAGRRFSGPLGLRVPFARLCVVDTFVKHANPNG